MPIKVAACLAGKAGDMTVRVLIMVRGECREETVGAHEMSEA